MREFMQFHVVQEGMFKCPQQDSIKFVPEDKVCPTCGCAIVVTRPPLPPVVRLVENQVRCEEIALSSFLVSPNLQERVKAKKSIHPLSWVLVCNQCK